MFKHGLVLIALLLAVFSVAAQTEEPLWADQQQKLTGSLSPESYYNDGEYTDWFGSHAVLDGESAYIAAARTMINGVKNTGIIYEFRRDGTRWVEYAQIHPPQQFTGKSKHLFFGLRFAVNGDQMIVYVPELGNYDDWYVAPPPEDMIDRLLYYVRISGVWTYVSEIPTPKPALMPTFMVPGMVLAGDTLAVSQSTRSPDPEGYISGRIHLFHLSDGQWKHETTLSVTTPNDIMCRNTGFGVSIDLAADGNTLVGGGGDAQQIWVFRRINGVWGLQQAIDAPELHWCSVFGRDVAISPNGQTIVAANPNAQSVDIFDYDGMQWQFTQRVTSTPPPGVYTLFGYEFDFDGESIIVQSLRNAALSASKYKGPAVIFRKIDGTWIQHGNLIAFEINELNEPVEGYAHDIHILGEYALIKVEDISSYAYSNYVFKIPGIQQDLPETIASRSVLSLPPAPRSEVPLYTTFEVSLKTRPSDKVQIQLKTNGSVLLDTGATASTTLLLTFNRRNWKQPQTVRARAAAHVTGDVTSIIKEKFSVESAAEYRWLTPKRVTVTVSADNFGAISPDNGAALPINQTAAVFSWHRYELATRYVLKIKNGKGVVSKITMLPTEVCLGDICTFTMDPSLLPKGKNLSWRVKANDKPASFAKVTDWRTLTRVQ